MLKINRLRIEIKTANEEDNGIYGFDEYFSDGLNLLTSIDNTTGKSSVLEAIYYGLGFEEIIGGANERVLTSVYKTEIQDAEKNKIWTVLESGVYVEISNGSEVVTIYRSAKHESRDSRLVTVYYGDYNSIGLHKTPPDDMYLHDPGSATNIKGFHAFLESFLHLQLPLVETAGNENKLYLQAVFSCLFIEQKHGWADLFSCMPYFGIKESKKRIVEFILGLETYKYEKEKQRLKSIKEKITTEWDMIIEDITNTAIKTSFKINGLPIKPAIITHNDFSRISLYTISDILLNEHLKQLNEEKTRLKSRKPRIVDNFDQLNSELEEVEKTILDYEEIIAKLKKQIATDRYYINQNKKTLSLIERDLSNNKDVAKLQHMGSKIGSKLANNLCPLCNQAIQDSLLISNSSLPVMGVEENIKHLKGQKSVLEFSIHSHEDSINNAIKQKNDLEMRLIQLRRLGQKIRSDLYSTEADWSAALVEKILYIDRQIIDCEGFIQYISQKYDELIVISNKWKNYLDEKNKLPPNRISDRDEEIMTAFTEHFISNLKEFEYDSAPDFKRIDIPIDTCIPTIGNFDMKFDSSASDNIRMIWSYTLALIQTSQQFNGNHPGIIIFDKPAQHSIIYNDLKSLIQSLLNISNPNQILVGITLDKEKLIKYVNELLDTSVNKITINNKSLKLLGVPIIRQANKYELSLISSFYSDSKSFIAGTFDEKKVKEYTDNLGEDMKDVCYVFKKDGLVLCMAWARICNGFAHTDNFTPELMISYAPKYIADIDFNLIITSILDELKKRGFKKVSAYIESSNNTLLNDYGFNIENTDSPQIAVAVL